MKFSVSWLREWLAMPLETARLAEQLTMAGLEVESITAAAPPISGVVVGRVVETIPHPNADRLRVCLVDTGDGDPRTIVCGASNVRSGLKVAVALPGSELPGDLKIRSAILRGVRSEGMICSATELRISDDASGIIELSDDAPIGAELVKYLQLDDQVMELKLTPNRGDCLGLFGIAREVATLNRGTLSVPELSPVLPASNETCVVEIDDPAACPRYVGRVVRGVNARAETPVWLRERLRRAGMRSLNPIVDVTNYVMLELGQPMHAFDRARVQGGIRVRCAAPSESLALLDGQNISLRHRSLVIADQTRPLALAGIMGGEFSAVSTETRDIVLESAFFEPRRLAEEARHFKLHTDASHRFERGVDFQGQARAMERATALIVRICGGEPGPTVVTEVTHELPRRDPIALREARIEHILGIRIASDEAESILERLGTAPERTAQGWIVIAPSFRFDIEREVDLIEEIARVHGYDAIPETSPIASMPVQSFPPRLAATADVRRTLVERGYFETITYSFIAEESARRIAPEQSCIALSNPISSEMGVMRTSLWPGLLKAATHNLNRQQERIRLFECGTVYTRVGDLIVEQPTVSAIALGPVVPEQWGADARGVDFFDLKADIEALIPNGASAIVYREEACAALHPGVATAVVAGCRTLGFAGRLHPLLERDLGFEQPVYLFELALDGLIAGVPRTYRPVSRFPKIRRDLSLVLDADIPVGRVMEVVRKAGTELLQDLQLFDEYHGQTIESGKKSVSLGLIFQASSSTLTDEAVDELKEHILRQLHLEAGATLRER